MTGNRDVSVVLTDGQIAQVLRDASATQRLTEPLSELTDFDQFASLVQSFLNDNRCSRSTLRALLVLACFTDDDAERELTSIAAQLGFSPSTTHRYLGTWLAVGLLEQDPRSRKYRRSAAGRSKRTARASTGETNDGTQKKYRPAVLDRAT